MPEDSSSVPAACPRSYTMLTIGLTGKTGAGKSTVAAKLKELGCYIIDCDLLARELTEPDSPVLGELTAVFGSDILDERGRLKRQLLAKRAFSAPQETEKLNAVTHPHITKRCIGEIERAKGLGYQTCVIDAAALLESGCRDLCQIIAVVHAPETIRLERILKRDSITPSQAMTRINGQKDDDYYFSRADIIIRNYPPYDRSEEDFDKLKELIR